MSNSVSKNREETLSPEHNDTFGDTKGLIRETPVDLFEKPSTSTFK